MSLENTLRTVLGGNDQPRVWALNICLAEKWMQQVDCGIGYHWLLTFTKFPNPSWISSVVACSVALWFVLRIHVRVKPEKQLIKTSDQQTNLKICLCKPPAYSRYKKTAKNMKNQSCVAQRLHLTFMLWMPGFARRDPVATGSVMVYWMTIGSLSLKTHDYFFEKEPANSRLNKLPKLQLLPHLTSYINFHWYFFWLEHARTTRTPCFAKSHSSG